MSRLFIYGFPSWYGGAASELYHQIKCWKKMGMEMHIIPSMKGSENEPLRQEMLDLGVTIHKHNEFGALTKDDAIINFCSKEFLENLSQIVLHTRRTIFVNCMTWVFGRNSVGYKMNEEWNHAQGNIAISLYQRPQIRDQHAAHLRQFGDKAKFIHFSPYFDSKGFEFSEKAWDKSRQKFTIGRISRQDADKFTRNLWQIWEGIHSPKWKQGLVLGWDNRSRMKCGEPLPWVKTHADQNSLPVQEFWKQVDIIVQPTETRENWPRIGFEAMYSGAPLVVDKRGGWEFMIEHGKSGFLCENERDFMFYASKLAYEPDFRLGMAVNAARRARELSGYEVASQSWKQVFEEIF
jgi:glycosyltransferase involved in cell wall biosynthesis